MSNVFKYSTSEVATKIPTTKKYQGVRLAGSKYIKNIAGRDFEIVFTENLTDFLSDYWDNPNNPGAYLGRDKIFDALKTKYVGVSRRDINNFLQNSETQQVHTIAPVVKVSRPLTPKTPLARW